MISSAHDLHQVVYVSRQVIRDSRITQSDLVSKILGVAIENNRRLNITGALLACDNTFVQVLEGRRIDVDAIMRRVSQDPNHAALRVIVAGPISGRRFAQWSMCASILSPTDTAIVEVLKTSGKFDGGKLTPESAIQLLLAVARLQGVNEPPAPDAPSDAEAEPASAA
jgi:hypothetical protein